METYGELQTRMHTLAVEKGTSARQIGDGLYTTHSANTPSELAYITSEQECTCPSFHFRGYCSHVAYVASLAAPAVSCQTCGDAGSVEKVNRYRPSTTFRAPCPVCRPAVVIRRLA